MPYVVISLIVCWIAFSFCLVYYRHLRPGIKKRALESQLCSRIHKGDEFRHRSRNPFTRYKVHVKEVRDGYVLFSRSESQRLDSCSASAFVRRFAPCVIRADDGPLWSKYAELVGDSVD